MLAGPLLYRSMILPEDSDWYPLRCLLEDQKEYTREWVQELTVERTGSLFAMDREKQVEERVELLMKLIESLPNLRDL
ncbi:hypothetical protein N7495_005173 [Penicillium taxi]|uniref:uncharacterized protein n=1 Tax=Penicillium taxi TaxID=168475 RepID=UPI0025459256|nr:uncharacterized protein N7495_005173 [Penicillium taxi]KAJ5893482.1 hypothetical protein N7495_005173 [Penicillium taxi]